MIDIQFVRDNPELVAEKAKQKGVGVDVKELLKLDVQRRELIQKDEELRQKRNELTVENKGKKPSQASIDKGKKLRQEIEKAQEKLTKCEQSFDELLKDIPNIFPDDTPLGGEEANKPEKHWGKARKNGEVDHLTWAQKRDAIDFERGAKVAGAKFYYLKGPLVKLEMAVLQLALDIAQKEGFTPMTVPHLVNTKTLSGTGFLPRGEEKQIYKIEGEDLNLIATSEIPITGYHSDETLDEKDLPILYAGISPSYRVEAGAYGKHSKGLYRVHQFNKVELYVFCKPEESQKWHEKLVKIEEKLAQTLEIPYRIVRIAAGDLGGPAYKKYDVEYWSPVDGEYRELMSCSNVTDYQARRLNIKYKNQAGKKEFVHTLNGTAAATSRANIALIENHQKKDGTIKVPKALRKYLGNKKVL